jgi:hypothetical protein
MNTIFFSRDLEEAHAASERTLMKETGVTVPSKPTVVLDDGGALLYRCNNLCTEFAVNDIPASKFEDALRLIVSMRPMLHARRFIRFTLLDRLSQTHAKVICHTMDRHGEYNVYFLISSTAGNVDLNMRSRFMLQNCNNTDAARAVRFTHVACDLLVSELLDQAAAFPKTVKPDVLFDLAHRASYKLCGSMIPVEHLCRSCVTVMGARCKSTESIANIVQCCANADAMKRVVNKPSLLFDYVLFSCICEFLNLKKST